MSEDTERTQHILLRILGVLLIAVGFTMLAGQVRSESTPLAQIVDTIHQHHADRAVRCERRIEVRTAVLPELPAMPPIPPVPPLPPAPPPPPLPAL